MAEAVKNLNISVVHILVRAGSSCEFFDEFWGNSVSP